MLLLPSLFSFTEHATGSSERGLTCLFTYLGRNDLVAPMTSHECWTTAPRSKGNDLLLPQVRRTPYCVVMYYRYEHLHSCSRTVESVFRSGEFEVGPFIRNQWRSSQGSQRCHLIRGKKSNKIRGTWQRVVHAPYMQLLFMRKKKNFEIEESNPSPETNPLFYLLPM